MGTTLIRSRHTVLGTGTLPGGAVLQRDGTIVEIGPFDDLHARHPETPVIGTGREVLLPGFVNAHHHVGLTPLQLGSPDMPLELWFVTRMVCRTVDPRLDTLFGAMDMISAGITTVQHIHGWVPGNAAAVERAADAVIDAYRESGMRASYCHAVREQNRLVYGDDAAFVASLPDALRGPMAAWFARFGLSLADMVGLFESLHARHGTHPRTRVQLAPANLHWCSDAALAALSDTAARHGVKLHMHLLETAYQKEYARRRTGSAVAHLERFGLLGPHMTLGHATWLDDSEIDAVARTGTCVCHNCSSNFRLRSGVAPLNRLHAAGVTLAIGLDEAGLNDDRDMLQEMRLVLRAHRVPGMNANDVPGIDQVFRMATEGGARTTGFEGQVGRIAVGMAADLVLLDWDAVRLPYLDPLVPVLDAVVQRAPRSAVRTVLCDGEVIYDQGRFTRFDAPGVLAALQEQLQAALSDEEMQRRGLSKALLPHVEAFYRGYIDPARHDPFYRQSSRT